MIHKEPTDEGVAVVAGAWATAGQHRKRGATRVDRGQSCTVTQWIRGRIRHAARSEPAPSCPRGVVTETREAGERHRGSRRAQRMEAAHGRFTARNKERQTTKANR